MPRGGARINAGRKPGIPNRIKQQTGFLRAAANSKANRGKPKLGVEYLQKNLRRFDALADEAWLDNEPALFTRYSNIVIQIATTLASFQTPRLSATATTQVQEWPVHIKQIEGAVADNSALAAEAKVVDADAAVTEPNKEAPAEPNKEAAKSEAKPEPPPPAPAPEPNAYGTSRSGLSLFGPWGHPNFNQHRSIERYRDLYRR
jgi:hypothetical protein